MQINRLISKYNFNPGTVDRIRYIVIHYTGSVATAKNNADYFAGGNRGASAHYFVGYEGEVWQSVEDANIAWHCGAKSYKHPECRNANSLGIELCAKTIGSRDKADGNWYFEDAAVDAAVELVRGLMQKYGIPADHVLRHYDVTGKICPAPYVFNTTKHTWDEFCSAIGNEGTEMEVDYSPIVWNFLTGGGGFSEVVTAGIMGNLYAESGLRPNNLQNSFEKKFKMTDHEYTDAIDTGAYSKYDFVHDRAGYGLAQWTYWSRKEALYDYVKEAGVSISNIYTQLGFLLKEFNERPAMMEKLKRAGTVREASDIILHDFEKPADQSEAVEKKRAEYGQMFFERYGDTAVTVPFLARTLPEYLSIQSGPGKEYEKTGKFAGKGVFTIIEVSKGWGKLKSGLGWIPLDQTESV